MPTGEVAISIADLARATAREIDADQVASVDTLLTAYVDDYSRLAAAVRRRRSADLGFGVGDAAALAPHAVNAAVAVVAWLATSAVAGAAQRVQDSTDSWISRMLRRRRPAPSPEAVVAGPLDPTQLSAVHDLVKEPARLDGLPTDRGELLAKAVVGALVLRLSRTDGDAP